MEKPAGQLEIMPKVFLFLSLTGLFYSIFLELPGFSYSHSMKSDQNQDSSEYSQFENWQDFYITENQYKIDVLHYDFSIALDYPSKTIEAVSQISILVTVPIESLDLNFFGNMKIGHLTINGELTEYQKSGTVISIECKAKAGDTIYFKISYSGKPLNSGDGSFTWQGFNGAKVISTLGEPNLNPSWFICNDRPDDKATLEMRITNDSTFTSVSNGSLVSVVSQGSKKTYHWRSTYPISTYLIALFSGQYERFEDKYISVTGDSIPLEYYVVPSKRKAAESEFSRHALMFEFMYQSVGEYPFKKEKYGVAGFNWQGGAMENQTITGVGHSLIGNSSGMETTYLHELAHHWFGNSVGPKTWRDIWLNEGFATYFEGLYLVHTGQIRAISEYMNGLRREKFRGSMYNPEYDDIFSRAVYDKGAWVLHSLRYEIGDSLFFRTVRNYYERFKYSNASTQDFQYICETVSGRDLRKFFNQYVYYGNEIPVVRYNYVTEKHGEAYLTLVSFEQENVTEPYQITFDLTLRGRDSSHVERITLNERAELKRFRTDFHPGKLIPDENGSFIGFIIPITN